MLTRDFTVDVSTTCHTGIASFGDLSKNLQLEISVLDDFQMPSLPCCSVKACGNQLGEKKKTDQPKQRQEMKPRRSASKRNPGLDK